MTPSDARTSTLAGGLRPRGQRGPRSRACSECKRHKIRCDMRRGEDSCVRCVRTGIDCFPYDPTQKFLDEQESWKAKATSQIRQLQAAVGTLLEHSQMPSLDGFDAGETPTVQATGPASGPERRGKPAASTSPADSALGNVSATESVIAPYDACDHTVQERRADDPGLVQAPMSNLNGMEDDLISRGVLSLQQGERFVARFVDHHNPLLWGGVVFPYTQLDEVRRASVLLSTCIFTIAALHSPGNEAADDGGEGGNDDGDDDQDKDILQQCYDSFVATARSSSLSRGHNNLDDVRALCLAAFYLPNLSWRLSGQAVRLAAEMNMHQSFRRLMRGDAGEAERVRLWYSLFVCDRHFSIAYGRPSAMGDDAAIRGVEQFIGRPTAVPGDVRISAQVALFRILGEAFAEYGTDQADRLTGRDLDRLRMYNVEVERWRLLWQPRSHDVDGIGAYPSQGVVMYYHFSRFQLNSLALRGVRWPSNERLCLGRREAAMAAISAAMSTLVHVLDEADIRRSLSGVPLFAHTMVAFCATFLLKIAALWARGGDSLSQALGLGFNPDEIVSLTRRSADMLSDLASRVSDRHITRPIVSGIREMLQRLTSADDVAAGPAMDGDDSDGLVYNTDLRSLAGLLEYGF
ncbi:Fungal trans [Geosmithia morbida]|uniref:Fungal trans n=1 Tax=Geosmithia morbida TaxID=1094350 RepID=A0A9P4YT03_9HYPO|nr:Fungal trans [Geosmithia morbida]KAF4121510.1 Fungal trans [Geosmithia morbida]